MQAQTAQKNKIKNLRNYRNDENIDSDNYFVMSYKLAKGRLYMAVRDDNMSMGDIMSYITEILEKYSPGIVFIGFAIEKMVRSQKSV